MTKNKVNRILSFLMTILILLSSTGFSMSLHYCHGKVKTVSFFEEAESCHQIKTKCHIPSQKENIKKYKKSCCANKTITAQQDDSSQKNTIDFTPKQVKFLTAFTQAFILKGIHLSRTIVSPPKHIPPLLNKDIPILIQSFLL